MAKTQLLIFLAALAIALLGVEGDSVAVKKRPTETTASRGTGKGARQHAGKRRGRAAKKTRKSKKKPDAKPDKPAEDDKTEEPASEQGNGGSSEAASVGSKLRKSAAEGLEPKPTLGAEGVMTGGGLRQNTRMEFDARVVRGETAGSGAVILFERGPRHLAPLTKKRTRFLDETIEGVLGKEEAIAAREKRERARRQKAKHHSTSESKDATKKSNGESNGKQK